MWGKHMKFAFFAGMNPFQKVNHFPGSFHLGRKDKLHLNLSRLKKNAAIELDFVPQTFLLPQESKAFQKAWKKEGPQNHRWIAKPPAASRGTGVFIVSRWSQISHKLQEALVVQRYIHRPLLIRGNKFDLRLYALVTCWDPLKIYVYKQGMLRFATMAYSESVDSLDNTFMHLTNYSLNKLSAQYSDEQKWTLDEFWGHLKLTKPDVDQGKVWNSLVNVIVKTLIAAEGPISRASMTHAPSRYSCFELFGFDVLLDAELRPWLLEVNISPSMRASSANDHAIKEPLIRDTLNLSGFRLPPAADNARLDPTDYGLQRGDLLFMSAGLHRKQLTVAEQQKHDFFTCEELELREGAILEKLLPNDITILADLEDELERSRETNFERVLPSADFEHLVPPRYNNKLLHAWENRYSENRAKGLAVLQELCRNGAHIVPSESEGKRVAAMVDKKPTPAVAPWRNSFLFRMRTASTRKPRPGSSRTPFAFRRMMRGMIIPPLRPPRRFRSSDSLTSQDSTTTADTTGDSSSSSPAADPDPGPVDAPATNNSNCCDTESDAIIALAAVIADSAGPGSPIMTPMTPTATTAMHRHHHFHSHDQNHHPHYHNHHRRHQHYQDRSTENSPTSDDNGEDDVGLISILPSSSLQVSPYNGTLSDKSEALRNLERLPLSLQSKIRIHGDTSPDQIAPTATITATVVGRATKGQNRISESAANASSYLHAAESKALHCKKNYDDHNNYNNYNNTNNNISKRNSIATTSVSVNNYKFE
ncbi:tubulin polyglutamylase TTLL4-like isoform X2 [Varroa destructor]|nr:tubulin polyglutamylase TTLL4-like isoform X2 [Varroa destructor]